jgi:hypothetical protein
MQDLDLLDLIVFNPKGLLVRGMHSSVRPPLHAVLNAMLPGEYARLQGEAGPPKTPVDQECAVLTWCEHQDGILDIATASRSRLESQAMRACLESARSTGMLTFHERCEMQPYPPLSWGLSLACYVLFPGGFALCSQPQASTDHDGNWSLGTTEIVVPHDVRVDSMQEVLRRHVSTQLAPFQGLGHQKIVALGLRRASYAWQLVGVVDLRRVEPSQLNEALSHLRSRSTATQWAKVSLHALPLESNLPAILSRLPLVSGLDSSDFPLVQFLSENIPA